MRLLLLVAALATIAYADNSKHIPPKVQLYSSKAGEFGMKNTLICHVSGFHPPDITIQLMKNGEELKGTNQTDLAFDDKWQFRLSKSVFFTPQNGEKYTCKVTHGMKTNDHTWDSNM